MLLCSAADVVRCPQGTPICVTQAQEGIVYQFEAQVARSQANTLIVPRCPPQIVQRRRASRILCDLQARYLRLKPRTEGSKLIVEVERKTRICDLSATGARGYAPEALFANTALRLRICLDGSEWITTDAIVLRCLSRPEKEKDKAEYPFEVCYRFTSLARRDALSVMHLVQQKIDSDAAPTTV